MVSTIGATIVDISMLLFVFNVVRACVAASGRRKPVGRADARVVDALAAAAVQLRALPVVSSREPCGARRADATHVSGLARESREGLVTTVLDAVPDVRYSYPSPGLWPFAAALSVGVWLIWSILSVQGALWGLIPPTIAFIAWYWPKSEDTEDARLEKEP
jgi:hypothetical protein